MLFAKVTILIISVQVISATVEKPIVTISKGKVQGIRNGTVPFNKTYWAFRGIPFAQPPIGELRFKPPEPVKPWSGVLDAVNDKSQCIQTSEGTTTGSEDCLYINIYTPTLDTNKSLAVMVYIYGGTFITGSGNFSSNLPDFFLDQDVVFVLFNYRLGIIGFLSTGDTVVPGNNGLRDQILALNFVKENIKNFGGDPEKITIFGESAGSTSVSYLVQTPLTKNLFRGAIMQSGSSLCLWSLSRLARKTGLDVGISFGIYTNDSQTLVDGLRKVDAKVLDERATLIWTTRFLLGNPLAGLIFAPVLEPEHKNAVITAKSHQLLQEGRFNRVPMIIGHTSQEANPPGSTDNIIGLLRVYLFIFFDLDISKLVPVDMNVNPANRSKVADKIKTRYWGSAPISSNIKATIQFLSDDLFNRPIRENVFQAGKYAPVYFYRFAYVGLLSGPEASPDGAAHAQDLNYLFRRNNINSSEADRLVRSRMVKLWTNFAKDLNPTPVKDPLLQNITWPVSRQASSLDNLLYLDIGANLEIRDNRGGGNQTGNPDKITNLQFWRELYHTYGIPPYDTY